MTFNLSAALPLILIGLALVLVAIALTLLFARRKTTVIDGASLKRDVLDEGAERARRNQALIDAAPAATTKPVSAPPPAPTPAPVAETTAEAQAAPVSAAAPAGADDLTRIKGIGPKLVALLRELGVTSFAQIAAWSEADVARVDAELGRFSGRITRDQWIAQAKLLSEGDEAGFAAQFGKNG